MTSDTESNGFTLVALGAVLGIEAIVFLQNSVTAAGIPGHLDRFGDLYGAVIGSAFAGFIAYRSIRTTRRHEVEDATRKRTEEIADSTRLRTIEIEDAAR